jgi:hypothetical protein
LTLNFPDGALAASTEITIQQLTDDEIAEKYAEEDNIDFVYELSPDGYVFLEPIQVSFLLPADANIDSPRGLIAVSNEVSEFLDDLVYDLDAGTITGTLSHFSELLSLPLSVMMDYPIAVQHFVGDAPKTFVANSTSASAVIGEEITPLTGEIVRIKARVDDVGGDERFTPVTVSGTERFVSVTNFETTYGEQEHDEDAVGDISVSFICNEAGIDTIKYRFRYEDDLIIKGLIDFVDGTIDVHTEVTCLASDIPPIIEPPETAVNSIAVSVAIAAEAVKLAGSPPYANLPDSTLQRFITSGTSALTIFNTAGEITNTIDVFAETYGSLFLQHSNGQDFFIAYGPEGRRICPIAEGFCQIDTPGFNALTNNTTSVEYGVDANGDQVFNQAYRVKNDQVLLTREEDDFWQEENVFDNEILTESGQSFNATVPLFAYEPLTPFTGIGITLDGEGYFVDTSACTAIEFSDTLGQGLRDIECDQFSTGNYGCAIQSFDDATITACSGSSGADFTCGSAVPAGDGVSLAATVNDAGNLAVMGADFTDSSIHVFEFTPTLAVELQIELFNSDWVTLIPGAAVSFDGVAHIEIDPQLDIIIFSGNGSNNAGIIPLDDLGNISLFGADSVDIPTWFSFTSSL